MIAVIFEFRPKDGGRQEYLDLAQQMGALVKDVDGFVSIERFESLTEPGKILSLSIWRDEDAVAAWRQKVEHRNAQARGRAALFADYRLRVAQVIRDYGLDERSAAPADSRAAHDQAAASIATTSA
jgi:heme-degrading monooxygenase HmoA